MDVRIAEGRLVEGPAADARGMDRRAFGEFVGPAGELVSYALGWTTGDDHGRLSIGFGRGIPGGATIHAVVFETESFHDFQLVDAPFEAVPEGGPDITADEACAHEDMPFMWWVVSCIFERDRRAWWLRHWLLGTPCRQTRQVSEHHEPVLLVGHDEDGLWQLTGSSPATTDCPLGHLSDAIEQDHSLLAALDLKPGQSASRSCIGGRWTRYVGYPAAAR